MADIDLNEQMRARFRELTAQRDAILAVSAPLRETRDAYLQAEEASLAEYRAEQDEAINAAEDGLFDIAQEIGRVSRYLDGKTGPVGTEADAE